MMVRLATICVMLALIAMSARAAKRASLEELAAVRRLPITLPPSFAPVKQSPPPARSFGVAPEYSVQSGAVGTGTKRDRTPVHNGPEFRSTEFLFRLVVPPLVLYSAAKYANNSISFRDEIPAFQC
jgi:hypothetical protein